MLKIKGLENLARLRRGVEQLESTTSIPFSELLSAEFLAENTRFTSLEQLFASGGFKVETREDLESIPDEQLDAHVRANSSFEDWRSMMSAALARWAKRKLDEA
ncbi:hypothetical protein [Variovorax sp.]|uniref:hypothetical protein n=1 Tax=Variovorax sp. TaxID=1871043 RepID=UPI000C409B0D|nr:hypothetical protein [Variovorax sp.]MBS79025.1 hypothetical protein [Variovorax sp.]